VLRSLCRYAAASDSSADYQYIGFYNLVSNLF